MQKLADAGTPPKALEDRPALSVWTAAPYEAFVILSESRSVTMGGVGPIPLSEINAYCQLYGKTDPEEIDYFIKLMRALDSEYLKWMGERSKQKNDRPDVAGTRVGGRRQGRMRRRG